MASTHVNDLRFNEMATGDASDLGHNNKYKLRAY